MIVQREPDEIRDWFVSFHTTSRRPWVRFVPSRYKHVAAFGFSERCRTWVWLDVGLASTRLHVLPDAAVSVEWIMAMTADASVLHMRQRDQGPPRWRFGFWCVPAVKHLLGLRGGALLPDSLWMLMLREGATIVHELRPGPVPPDGQPARAGA